MEKKKFYTISSTIRKNLELSFDKQIYPPSTSDEAFYLINVEYKDLIKKLIKHFISERKKENLTEEEIIFADFFEITLLLLQDKAQGYH